MDYHLKAVALRDRPKFGFGFGFGFGAERRLMCGFGHLSVSAESELQPFGRLTASAESQCDFRRHTERAVN